MNVQQVNLFTQQQNNNRPSFKGYVDRSVIDLINHATANSINSVVKKANTNNSKVNTTELLELKNFGTNIIIKLTNFMKKFHKDTTLIVEDRGLHIANSELGTKLSFNSGNDSKNSGKIFQTLIDIKDPASNMKMRGVYREIDTERLTLTDLENLDNFANQTRALVDADAVDKQLFQNFTDAIALDAKKTSLLGKIKLLINARKADKVAAEFGGTPDWKTRLTTIREEALAKKRKEEDLKKQAKQLEIENNKVMRRILGK